LTVPSAFDTWVIASSRVRSPSRPSKAAMSSSPLSCTGITLSTAPVCSHTSCQGTMLEWCSMVLSRISSPAASRGRPQLCATRLIASVVPRVNTISSARAALRKRCTVARAPS
jgi:hypothetical protein